jgi:hypothetical protein
MAGGILPELSGELQSGRGRAPPRERPLLMSVPNVRAILDGRKAQTRRFIKPQPEIDAGSDGVTGWPDWWLDWIDGEGYTTEELARKCPYGHPGDRLWVRETWQTGMTESGPQIAYAATSDICEIDAWDGEDFGAGPSFNYDTCPKATWHTWLWDLVSSKEGNWRPSIFMPRWASRITLEIAEVRIERLQDISAENAIAEGIALDGHRCGCERCSQTSQLCPATSSSLVMAYSELREAINGNGSWDTNPWVWVLGFRRVGQ